MMEVKDETSYVLHHAQKIIATFAAMRFFAESTSDKKDLKLFILKLMIKKIEQSFYQNINKIIKEKKYQPNYSIKNQMNIGFN